METNNYLKYLKPYNCVQIIFIKNIYLELSLFTKYFIIIYNFKVNNSANKRLQTNKESTI